MVNTLHGLCQTVCVVLCVASDVTSSDVYFTSNPSTIRPLLTDQLTLRCSLKDSPASVVIGKLHVLSDVISDTAPSDVSFVQTIVLTKSGVELATVTEHLAAKVFDNTTGVQVAGQVPGTGGEKGYLQVSWTSPDFAQSGSYQCDVRGVDQNGHVHDFSQSLDVSESEVSIRDVVGYIHKLKHTNDLQTDLIGVLNTTNAELKTKLDTHVIFSAFRGSPVTVSAGHVVVFDQLQTNVGGGYDPHTGIFTCPVGGYYLFHIHLESQSDKEVYVCLTHNGNCVAKALANDLNDWQTGSNSVNILLQRGDTVKVTSSRTSYVWPDRLSSYSGHLLALV